MRVAVSQFATSLNVQENLATCIRVINEAAACKPALIVLPEFSNTLFCSKQPYNEQAAYVDHNQAWDEALATDGAFLQGIAEQAKDHHCYIVINVTLRRDLVRDHQDGSIKSNITVTSCLFSPLGDLIHQTDKSTLTGHEQEYFISAKNVSEVALTPLGKIGMVSGSDSMTFESSRELSLAGAQFLCHSMNTFTRDESDIHVPTRASENKVFLASANKIGSLIPKALIAEETTIPEGFIPPKYLTGVGQSQIVSPNGKILAKLDNDKEGYIYADIALVDIDMNEKRRPDGTDLIKQRRPELYRRQSVYTNKPLLVKSVHEQSSDTDQEGLVPATANIAIFATYRSNEQAIEDVCFYIENNLSDIIQLPELFFVENKTIINNAEKKAEIELLSAQLIKQISDELRPFQYVCTSLIINGKHQAVLINDQGLYASQQQLHFCQRYLWTELGNEVNVIELPLEQGNIKVAMLTADDANIPELVNVAALSGIHALLVPFDIQERCEVEYHLIARAAENRICIVAASREKNFSLDLPVEMASSNSKNKKKIKFYKSTGLIANLAAKETLLAQWRLGKPTGYFNQPLVKHQQGKITKALIYPNEACHKL